VHQNAPQHEISRHKFRKKIIATCLQTSSQLKGGNLPNSPTCQWPHPSHSTWPRRYSRLLYASALPDVESHAAASLPATEYCNRLFVCLSVCDCCCQSGCNITIRYNS